MERVWCDRSQAGLARRLVLDWSDQEVRGSGHGLEVRHAVMAMTVDAVAMPLVVGQLLVIPLLHIGGDVRRYLDFRLASDGINRPTKHHTQKQQQGRKAPSASKRQTEEHFVGSTIFGFTFSHSPSRSASWLRRT